MIEEWREKAVVRVQNYQQAAARYYDSNVRNRVFSVGYGYGWHGFVRDDFMSRIRGALFRRRVGPAKITWMRRRLACCSSLGVASRSWAAAASSVPWLLWEASCSTVDESSSPLSFPSFCRFWYFSSWAARLWRFRFWNKWKEGGGTAPAAVEGSSSVEWSQTFQPFSRTTTTESGSSSSLTT